LLQKSIIFVETEDIELDDNEEEMNEIAQLLHASAENNNNNQQQHDHNNDDDDDDYNDGGK
jgi:hypothetical protein